MSVTERERDHYNKHWRKTKPFIVEGTIDIPEIGSLNKKRVLICSCGAGYNPVKAAKEGAEVFAFDISETAIEKAREMASYNGVSINAEVMDFHALKYPDNYFDVIYGTMILHHIDCSVVSRELYRCLKPEGVAFFHENSDRNPFLRFIRRAFFGKPGEIQKSKFLFFKRHGTTDEYPLTEEEIDTFRDIFGEKNVRLFYPKFVFFQCLYMFGINAAILKKITLFLDNLTFSAFPFVRKYSFVQDVWMKKNAI